MDSKDPKHLQAGISWSNETKPEGLKHYAVKYASKMRQKVVPDGFADVGRFWGRSKNITCTPINLVALDESTLRESLTAWKYLPDESRPMHRVLFNASQCLRVRGEGAVKKGAHFDNLADEW